MTENECRSEGCPFLNILSGFCVCDLADKRIEDMDDCPIIHESQEEEPND